jgi:hypothetical protein
LRTIAGVDLVAVSEPSALARLAASVESAGGVPLIAVMAFVTLSECDLGSITEAAHHTDGWDGALALLAEWRGPLPAGGVRFRGSALRDAAAPLTR